jgi:hypothetical protein
VRVLAFPDDLLRVRLYRHEGQAYDGLWQLDTAFAPEEGTLVASVGLDGKAHLLHMDATDLMPYRRKEHASRLYSLLALKAAHDGGRVACDVAWRSSCIALDQTETSPRGDICQPIRAGCTAVRVAALPLGEPPVPHDPNSHAKKKRAKSIWRPVVAVGTFSGLCRLVDVERQGSD